MKHTKKILLLSVLLGILIAPVFVHAEDASNSAEDTHKEKRVQLKEKLQGINKDPQDKKKGVIDELKTVLKDKLRRGKLVNGQVTSIESSKISVSNNGKIFSVVTDSNTKCERHFWGKCSLSEIAVNDKINVWGTYTDDAKTTIQAKLIRDLSIMKRYGVFMGDVVSKSDSSFVLKSKERGNQTVNISSSTKYVMRKGQASSYADLKVGNRVQVRGVWDKANNTVSLVTHVKNFSLTVKTEVTPTVSVSPIVTVTSAPSATPSTTLVPTATLTPTPAIAAKK